ncbi:MAG: NAD(P)H-binding protein [Actinobacteria bacterium]|nr:NAD(P)H-binding protein [Actinomycetota bacterium]
MRIAVVGGAGTVGKHITAQLADSGHEVRVLSRHSREFPVDLTSGQGLASALAGCDVVVDSSHSQRQARQVLVEGTARLLAAEQQAGVGHHVAISIVGCDEVPYGYQKIKVEQERVVERGSVPWTIVRATQFYELVAQVLAAAGGYRLLPAPNMPLQPVAAADVGRAVAGAAVAYPRRGRISVAGPEVATARQLARTWLSVTGRSAALIPVPLPGRTGRKLRDGALIPRQPDVTGTITFADWLAAQVASG